MSLTNFIDSGECVVIIKNLVNTFRNTSLYKGVQKQAHRFEQGALDLLPDATFNKPKTVKMISDIGHDISSAENRLILGVTALMTQPFIDAKNKNVDEETRRVSVCRTIAKIIAGTLTGYAIRKGAIKAIRAWSQLPAPGVSRYRTLFTPKGARHVGKMLYETLEFYHRFYRFRTGKDRLKLNADSTELVIDTAATEITHANPPAGTGADSMHTRHPDSVTPSGHP